MNRFAFVAILAIAAAASPAIAVGPAGIAPAPTDSGKVVTYKQLMTVQERNTFRNKVRTSASLADCEAYIADWKSKIEARAKEKGVTDVKMPPAEMCERKRKPDAAAAGDMGEKAAAAPSAAAAPAKK